MMGIKDEGYIKFNIEHTFGEINIPLDIFKEIGTWRTKLFDLQLIGENDEGIGYGNISMKFKNGFLISGSATGKFRDLGVDGYAYVHAYNFKKNMVMSEGMSKASSESLSHAVIYECNKEIGAVIHIHNKVLWNEYIYELPTTSSETYFGTPELAFGIKQLLENEENLKEGIVIMGGHEDGILAFGKNMEDTGKKILSLIEKQN